MKTLEAITEAATTALEHDPIFVLALLSILLAGFAIYAVLVVVKQLTRKEG